MSMGTEHDCAFALSIALLFLLDICVYNSMSCALNFRRGLGVDCYRGISERNGRWDPSF